MDQVLPEVFIPGSTAIQPISEFHDPSLVPSYLQATEEDEQQSFEPPEVDFTTLKRLDPPAVVTPEGYKLVPEVATRLQELNALYLKAQGKTKCFRCCNTGIFKYVAKGATAKVCECVRQGAEIEVTSQALAEISP